MIWHRNDMGLWKDRMNGLYGSHPDYTICDTMVIHKSHGVVERFEINVPTAPTHSDSKKPSILGTITTLAGISFLVFEYFFNRF